MRPYHRPRRLASAVLILVFSATIVAARELPRIPVWLEGSAARAPALSAEAGILLDYDTGTVLFEKRADRVIPPASLTKVMTIHLALELSRDGVISLDEDFPVPEAAWARNMPPDSSLMFLGPGQSVDLRQLLVGLSVASGNDAAVAVALRLAGSVPAFVELMNAEAARLGYPVMQFADPAGLSPRNQVTPREYADFVRHHITRWPETLDEVYSVPRIVYPTEANFDSVMIGGSVRQENRNDLLFDYEGVDGLKTGFIEASGYNLAVTAERNGRRLIAVVLGVRAGSVAEGSRRRAEDAASLLDYGFAEFAHLSPRAPGAERVRVWKGRRDELRAVPAGAPPRVIVPRGRAAGVAVRVDVPAEVTAPVEASQEIGTASYMLGESEIARVGLVSDRTVERAGLFKRLWHTLRLFARRLFG